MDQAGQTPSCPDTPPTPQPDLTGQTLGDFHILRRLGQGGMGQVYLAEQLSLKRKVALKLLRADLAANDSALKRFQQEAEAVARATHANIVQVYAIGNWQGLQYMALEYVEGRNLREYLARKGPPELLVALSIMRQVASALQRASELGIIHRDIKPENILLTRKGEAKVADFGLSRCIEGTAPALNLTQSGIVMGTPLYMSPEQVEGKPVDARTDIYSFGVTCYHLLAGEPPYRGNHAFEVALQHVRGEAPPLQTIRPDLPATLCALVHKMMARIPEERYQSCRDLLRDLARVREGLHEPSAAVPMPNVSLPGIEGASLQLTPAPRSASALLPRRRSRRWLVAVGLLLSLVLAAGAGIAAGLFQQQGRSPAKEGEVIEPVAASETIALQKREQMLRDALEHFLDPSGGFRNPALGVQLSLDLCLNYLDQGRLKEADELFLRLEGIQQEPMYHVVGTLGRAIVLALEGKAVESNTQFGRIGGKVGDPAQTRLLELCRTNRQLARWLAEALYHNQINGIPFNRIPKYLVRFVVTTPRPPDRPLGTSPARQP